MNRLLEIGGWGAGIVLVLFGLAVVLMSVNARGTVRSSIAEEKVSFGSAEDPAVAEHAARWAGRPVETGTQARAFANIIRAHTTQRSGGLTYAEMGRFAAAADPDDPAGTSDAAAALLDESGQPVPNRFRDTWVTAMALTAALNMAYLAEQLALFGLVVGLSLVIVGIGFLVLNGRRAMGTAGSG